MRSSVLAALLLVGCVEARPLPPVEAADGDLVVLAVTAPDGTTSVRSYIEGAAPPSFAIEEDDELYAWVLARRDVVDADGAPVTDLGALEVGLHRPDDRCLGATAFAPHVLYPGDRCPLPSFAASQSSGDGPRASVAIGVAGAAPCEPHRVEPVNPSWDLVAPDPNFWPYDAVATTQGVTAVFSEHRVVRTDRAARTAPFAGPVHAAAGTASGTFVVAAENIGVEAEGTDVTLFDEDLDALRTVALNHRTQRIRRLGDQLLFLGHTRRQPRALVCDDELDCAPLNVDGLALLGGDGRDAVVLDDGLLALIFDKGVLLVERVVARDEAPEPVVADDTHGTIRVATSTGVPWRAWPVLLSSAPGRIDDRYNIVEARRVGDQGVALCVDGVDGSLLLYGTYARAHLEAAPPAFEVVLRHDFVCGGLSDAPGGAVRAHFVDGRGVQIGADGTATALARYEAPGLPSSPARLSTIDGRTYARLGDDRLYVDEAPFTLLYGPEAATRGRVVALLAGASTVVYASGAIVAPSGERTTMPIDVAASDGETILVGGSDATGAWVQRFDGEQLGEVVRIDAPGLRAVAPLRAGWFVVATSDGRLLRLADTVDEIAIRWDDPSTTATEVAPTGRCDFGIDIAGDPLRGADGGQGAGWIVGCQGLVLRVHPYADPPIAWRVATERADQPLDSMIDVPLYGVDASCPDDVIVAGPDVRQRRELRGVALAIVGADSTCAAPFDDRCLIDADLLRAPPTATFTALGHLRRVHRRGASVLLGYDRGVRGLATGDRFVLADAPSALGSDASGFVFGTSAGRIFESR